MDSNAIVSLLGLCLRGNHLAVGEEPVADAAQACSIRLLLLAADAPDPTRRRAERFAREGQCLLAALPVTKAELGRALGRASVAMAAVTDLGLAGAVAGRLAQQDPARYGDLAQRMELKAKRAAERRRLHEVRAKAPQPRTEKQRGPDADKQPPLRAERAAPGGARPAGKDRRPRTVSGPRDERRSFGKPPAGKPSPRSGARHAGKPGGGPGPKRGSAPDPYANSRPVKKGKGSFRKKGS